MQATDYSHLGEIFETFLPTNTDSKGRVFGYVVGLREILATGEHYAWVQRSIRTADGWKNYGSFQRSKKFPSLAAARTWAYATANERAQKAAA